MAGTLYILQHHYLGLQIHKGSIYLNPSFPEQLSRLRLSLQHQYNDLQIEKTDYHLHITAVDSNSSSIRLVYQGEAMNLEPGASKSFTFLK